LDRPGNRSQKHWDAYAETEDEPFCEVLQGWRLGSGWLLIRRRVRAGGYGTGGRL
jgi:hypothetical protein